MQFSEIQLKRLLKKGYENFTTEDKISFNILNFINCVHLNKEDFYSEYFESKHFGDIEMEFNKPPNCLIGHCKVKIKENNKTIYYLFTENGYEKLEDVMD